MHTYDTLEIKKRTYRTIYYRKMIALGTSNRSIGRLLDRPHSTINNEAKRGTNENHNRMIRRFIPKGKRISEISNSMIRNINLWMNKYPRKIFNYLTPHDLFEVALQTQS